LNNLNEFSFEGAIKDVVELILCLMCELCDFLYLNVWILIFLIK